jgi:hemerythrin
MFKDFPMELITGIEKIDIQHMELISRIKELHESYLNGTNTEKLMETFHYIRCYINEHFATEENYMLNLNYPNYQRHLNAHRDFVTDYLKLEKLLKKDGLSSDFNLDFNVQLIDWMKNHVLEEDKILADFIRETNANSEQETIDINLNNE